MQPQDDKLYKKLDVSLLRRLLQYLKPYTRWIIFGFFLAIISSTLPPLRPLLTKIAIDDYVVPANQVGLLEMVFIIVGVMLLGSIIQYSLTYLMQWIGQKVLLDIRLAVFKHIQRFSLRYYDTTPVGRLITRVTNDVEALNELFSSGVVLIIADALLIIAIVCFMLYTSWKLTIATIIVLPLLFIATTIFRRKVRVVYAQIRTQIARMNSFLNEYITGATTIQLFSRQASMFTTFDDINSTHTKLQLQSVGYYARFFPVVEMIGSLALSAIIWYAARTIFSKEMTVGVLIAFMQYSEMFFRPIRDLTEKYNTLQSAMAAAERIFGLLDTENAIEDAPDATPLEKFSESIEFRNVTFAYDGVNPVLKNLNFTVKKGQTVAIVGATGSGKSSIINLLCRFYDFQEGDILIDGRSIRSIKQESLRARIALVLQDVFLFSRSVGENISLGREYISNESVRESAEALGASEFIEQLPNGYETQMIERAANLSVGQKQLISFSRALATNPDILILDEATSSIDTETEQLIERSINRLLEGRTSIVIAHRLSTIQRADLIVVLHQGEIREIGTHEQLIGLHGLYSKLHTLQYKEQLKQNIV
jgi:ATP-binding cassette subfamily B protein